MPTLSAGRLGSISWVVDGGGQITSCLARTFYEVSDGATQLTSTSTTMEVWPLLNNGQKNQMQNLYNDIKGLVGL